MLSSKRIRDCIKQSPFKFGEIASALDMCERNLHWKLQTDSLKIKEINIILQLLNVDITEFEKE